MNLHISICDLMLILIYIIVESLYNMQQKFKLLVYLSPRHLGTFKKSFLQLGYMSFN